MEPYTSETMAKPKIAVIIGTTRATRFGEKPAKWIYDIAAARADMSVELIDLREYPMPFFDEPIKLAHRNARHTQRLVEAPPLPPFGSDEYRETRGDQQYAELPQLLQHGDQIIDGSAEQIAEANRRCRPKCRTPCIIKQKAPSFSADDPRKSGCDGGEAGNKFSHQQ